MSGKASKRLVNDSTAIEAIQGKESCNPVNALNTTSNENKMEIWFSDESSEIP